MQKIIVANWKCNPLSLRESKNLFDLSRKNLKKDKKLIICPPFIYISELRKKIKRSSKIKLGGQNCFWKENGPFTGEISPTMLKNSGCEYVIIGHSERREFFFETNEMINKKIKEAIKIKLIPIFCIGETEKQRAEDKIVASLKNQLEQGLKDISLKRLKSSNLIIAYEPVWAIGSGKSCCIDDLITMNLLIKKILYQMYNFKIIKKIPFLYGGSVDKNSAKDYLENENIDGILLGSASLQVKEFKEILIN